MTMIMTTAAGITIEDDKEGPSLSGVGLGVGEGSVVGCCVGETEDDGK